MKTADDFYTKGGFLANVPSWNAEHCAWKSKQILSIVRHMAIPPTKILEIGCGSAEILKLMQNALPPDTILHGYDISADAIRMAKKRENEHLKCFLGRIEDAADDFYDLVIIADVIEHLENPYDFLRQAQKKAPFIAFLIPLDMNVDYLLKPQKLMSLRKQVGHIHYFCEETALATVEDAQLDVITYKIVNMYLDEPGTQIIARIRRNLKRLLFRLFPKAIPRLFGFFTLAILARQKKAI